MRFFAQTNSARSKCLVWDKARRCLAHGTQKNSKIPYKIQVDLSVRFFAQTNSARSKCLVWDKARRCLAHGT